MIVTKQKLFADILKAVAPAKKLFLIGCGECATVCNTGGDPEIAKAKSDFEAAGIEITGTAVPKAPCTLAALRIVFFKDRKAIERSDGVIVYACGLGAQSVKESMRLNKPVHIGCDTLFMTVVDGKGDFYERCSACGDCMLEMTGTICPITRCPKSLMNGPCGGQNKGKCEVNPDRDCAWVLIYNDLKKKGGLDFMRAVRAPRDHSKSTKPRQITKDK